MLAIRLAAGQIELPWSLGFSDVEPIGGVVTRAPETISLNKHLQQDGLIAIPFCPIVAQTFGGGAENTGR